MVRLIKSVVKINRAGSSERAFGCDSQSDFETATPKQDGRSDGSCDWMSTLTKSRHLELALS